MSLETPLRPFIRYGRHFLNENDIQSAWQPLRRGALTQGPKIAEFEETVAQYGKPKFAVAVSGGAAALHLAYLALEPKSGDRFVTFPNTFVATSNGAFYFGADPYFFDIHPETLSMMEL